MNIKIFNSQNSESSQLNIQTLALSILLCMSVILSVYFMSLGWGNTIADMHAFRQTQTAITTYYLQKGGAIFAYETPVMGAPWSIPMEFPAYQIVVAKISSWFELSLDQAGRTVSVLSFLGSLVFLYKTLLHFNITLYGRISTIILLLLSPIYVFWSRTFMIESFTLFLCLVYLWLYMSARKGYNYWPWLCAATIIGIFAATSKVTTFFTFAIFVSLIMLVDLYKYNKSKQLLKRMPRLAVSVLSLAIPTAAVFIWTKYSDYIKSQNPLANNFITSDSLTRWNFGTWEQKTDLSIWETILSRQIELGIGSIAALLVALTVLVCFKDQKRLMIFFLCIGLFLVAPVVFTNLHYVHEYYAYANSLFLVIAISCSVEAWISRPGKYYFITGLALLLFFSFNQIYKYRTSFYFSQQSKNFTFPQSTTEPISKHTNPDDIIYVVGQDWNSIYAYYSRRRAIMDRYNLSTDSNLFKEVINNTGKNNIGAFIACRELKGDRKMFVDKLSFFGFSEIPINAGACEIYLPKDKA